MKINEKKLIKMMKEAPDWVTATYIADTFHVSTRTIRNYIKQVNALYPDLIESSYKGYRLYPNNDYELIQPIQKEDNRERQIYILKRLVNASNNISVYDLADELYISDSQFNRDLNSVKDILSQFHIQIERQRNHIALVGEELNKRKLINNLITTESMNGFLSIHKDDNLFIDNQFDTIKIQLQQVLENNNLYANDYAFNTILVHILIMIMRVKSNNVIQHNHQFNNFSIDEQSNEYRAANHIDSFIFDLYQFHLPPLDLYYLALIISNNCFNKDTPIINIENINKYVDKIHISLTQKILHDLRENYCLDNFSDEFVVNFTIHISNLFSRLSNHMYTKNPLAKDFKEQYPLIYDMATFVIKEIHDIQPFQVNDDEIAFIGFHIGSYLEKNSTLKEKINCCFLYTDYHDIYLTALEKINTQLNSLVLISSVVSVKDASQIPKDTELIISSAGKSIETNTPHVDISILVSTNDIHNIRKKAEKIFLKKRHLLTKNILDLFIGEQLFKKDVYFENEFDMIYGLGKECIKMNLCDEEYIQNIIDREKISSTSFKNGVAIPHSLKATAKQSFLYIISNTEAMKWGDHYVNIIVMIGISTHDRQEFKTIFDTLIQLLYEVDNVRKLTTCNDYTSLLDTLLSLMNETMLY